MPVVLVIIVSEVMIGSIMPINDSENNILADLFSGETMILKTGKCQITPQGEMNQ